jgi:DNA-directed DNA polymerase III PolC
MPLTHLHVRSAYSLLEGLAEPHELAQAAAQYGLAALALTDHHRLTGAIQFYDACVAVGVRPIIGLALDVGGPAAGTLTLLAESDAGWASLCRLSSLAHGEAEAARPLALEQLAANTGGLVCLSGGRLGPPVGLLHDGDTRAAQRWLDDLRHIFPSRFYAELQLHDQDDQAWVNTLARLAHGLGVPCAATHTVAYLQPEQAGLQRTLAAIRLNKPVQALTPADVAPPEAWFLPPGELQRRFEHYPQALAGIEQIAERCHCTLPLGQARFPQANVPEGLSAMQALRQRAEEGMRRLYCPAPACEPPAEVVQRLEHELEVIEQTGFEALFLVMAEIVAFARREGIPIASRGSASSSLAAHCLDITTPDPVRLNLYFERFLNPARRTPPDIDTDLCSRRRDEVIAFVYRRFGDERVAMVCTINRFRSRSALRDVAKAYGLPPAEVDRLAEGLPQRWWGPPFRRSDDDPYAELRQRYLDPLHQAVLADAAALRGRPRHLSIHPGGTVIAPGPLTELCATQMAAKGVRITQFDLDSIERLGLVKLDLLGIRGLTVLGDVARRLAPHNAAPREAMLILENAPEDDLATADTVEHGRTIGCFQIESPGMRATLREIHARTPDDILAALALYRPGPLTGGLKDAFVARYRGQEVVSYLHPSLQPILGDTFGVILYQEQVLRLANQLAGFSLADADLLRRAMSHFDPGKQMQTLKERFIAGAGQRHAVPAAAAERIWEQMAAFAGYGFPKAHAASYAKVAWQSAWCKTHHPAPFLAAVLANWGGYYSQRVYLMEARRLGLPVRPPHINHALPEFSAQVVDGKPTLFMGLNQVRDLTHRTQKRILHERPFRSLIDFLARVDPRQQEAENLVQAGALEGLGAIPAMLRQVQDGGWRGGQLALFDLAPQAEDWPLEQRAAAQERLLGVSLAAHPLELHPERVAAAGVIGSVEAAGRLGQMVRVAGMRQTWRRSSAGEGNFVYFMSLEDLEGMTEVVIPGWVYSRGKAALNTSGPYVIEGRMEWDAERGEPFLRAEKIEAL